MSPGNRLLAPFLLALLVAATLFAFLVVEKERNHPTIIDHGVATPRFEPGAAAGAGVPRKAEVCFLITHPEAHATIVVVDRNEVPVDTLAEDVSLPDDSWHCYFWDGTTSSGTPAPPGLYRVRARLGDLGRDLPLPSMQLLPSARGGG